MPATNTVSQIYNPLNQTESELMKSFVVREKEFETIFRDIESSRMQHAEPHYIIQGQRGQGKTTLLLKLYYEIKKHKELSKFVIPVIFNEEQYQINSLFELWSYTAEELEDENPDFPGLYDQMEDLYESAQASSGSPVELNGLEMDAFKLLEKTLKGESKKLILLMDNIGQMLDKFTGKEQQRLREVLLTCPEIRIIGASAVVLEHTYDYSKPFYELFHIINLDGLTRKETETLFMKLGEYYKQGNVKKILQQEPGRLETLRRLSGGVPRTMVLLFEIFIDHEKGSAFLDLEYVLDRVTPLYKHRMDDLSAQQQKIVNAIALNWDAMATKDIAKMTRMASKAVSSHLKLLERNRVIRKVKTTTKNHIYSIAERFFNIWYLMRYGRRRGKNRVLWLVHFLEEWCSDTELAAMTQKHIRAMDGGMLYPRHALYFTEALAGSRIKKELQHRLISHARECLAKNDQALAAELSHSDKELFEEAEKHYKEEGYRKALACCEAIQQKDENVLELMGKIYNVGLKKYKKAEKYYLIAVEKGIVGAMVGLGDLYYKGFKDYKKAEKYYLMAVGEGNTKAMEHLGTLYRDELKDFKKAEQYYFMALEKGDITVAFSLGYLFHIELEDFKKAEKYYLMVAKEGHGGAMNNLGNLYRHQFPELKKAEKYYLMAVEKGAAIAIGNLGILYENEFKDFKNAEKYYLMAAEKGDTNAINNLGILYENEFKDIKKAEKYYLMAVEKGDIYAMRNLGLLYEHKLKDIEKAEKYYLMAAEKGDAQGMQALAVFYFYQKKNKEKVLELVKKVAVEKISDKLDELGDQHNLSMALLWNKKIEESLEIMHKLMEHEEYLEEYKKIIREYLIHLLAKKQFYATLKIFNQNRFQLKERVKPIYYALMHFLKDDFPNEYRKMGTELEQTVEEVIQTVKQWEKDYA